MRNEMLTPERHEERKRQSETILQILHAANRPLSLQDLFDEYRKHDKTVKVATLLNGVIWELVDLGKADFNSDWKLHTRSGT